MSNSAVLVPAEAAGRFRSVGLICNEAAGGVKAGDGRELLQRLGAHGLERVRMLRFPVGARVLSTLGPDDLVIVLGGDGTARAVAEACARPNSPVLALLPGGTLNVLPHVLYGERPWREALEAAMREGEVRALPGATANGRSFFVAASFGAPALLANAREAMRHGELGRAWRSLRRFFVRAFTRRLQMRLDGAEFGAAEALGVLCESFPDASPQAKAMGMLEWARFDGRALEDLARLGVTALVGDWRADEAISCRIASAGEIRSAGLIPATLDGEPLLFSRRVRIAPLQTPPRVLALPEARA